jgi:UDP-N-acetylmuramate dehydrogenase
MPPFRNNVPLYDKTSFKIGGPARLYCDPATIGDIVDACNFARSAKEPLFVLGKGTNLLISDTGWNGAVIDLSTSWTGSLWNGKCAECKSGMPLHALVKESVENGLRGLEKLAGIPGSVGGAVVMNAGAFGQCVSDCVTSVRYLDTATCAVQTVDASEMASGYRSSIFFKPGACVLEATFCFANDADGTAKQAFAEVLAKRKTRHPLDLPNCGSVFKNPAGATAGALVEQCGLKGQRRGNAEVSRKHANFIVNLGNASAADVRALIAHIQRTVRDKTGILLQPEVIFVGDFEEPLLME